MILGCKPVSLCNGDADLRIAFCGGSLSGIGLVNLHVCFSFYASSRICEKLRHVCLSVCLSVFRMEQLGSSCTDFNENDN